MTTTKVVRVDEEFHRGNPFFRTLSQTLHLPFTYAEYQENGQHITSLWHEYFHLLQAQTTTWGAYCFIGTTERLVYFFNAIGERAEVLTPIREWSKTLPDDTKLADYAEYEEHFQTQMEAADGPLIVEVPPGTSDFDVFMGTIKVAGSDLDRLCVARRVDAKLVAFPILGRLLMEAQAEVGASYVTSVASPILQRIEKEAALSDCYYTTVPGLVRRRLPSWPFLETTFFLCEYGLSSFTPDQSFLNALLLLEQSKPAVPTTSGGWDKLWHQVDAEFGSAVDSRGKLRQALSDKIALYKNHDNGDHATALFIQRLQVALKAARLRELRPMHFFPCERSPEAIQRCMDLVPIAEAYFEDGLRPLGQVSDDSRRHQAILTAISHIHRCAEGGAARCPLIDDQKACTSTRTLDCQQAPWMRGDIGNGATCPMGSAGMLLGIASSPFVPLRR